MQLSSHVIAFIAFIATTTWTFAAAQSSSSSPLPCYQTSCSTLIDQLKECQVAMDPSTGNLNFPVQVNTSVATDKCLCKQSIINAYEPCYMCGAENQKVQDRFSTQKLVDSCNLSFGARTVSMPGTSAAMPSKQGHSSWVAAVQIVTAAFALVMV